MKSESPLGLIERHFAQLKYPRVERTKRHKLLDIIVITICGVICGADDWVNLEIYGNAKLEWFKTFLELPNGIPSHDTFGRVFVAINPQGFEKCFIEWVNTIHQLTQGQVIAIDGKQLRGSSLSEAGKSAIYMVNAWASANKLVLDQLKVDEKTNLQFVYNLKWTNSMSHQKTVRIYGTSPLVAWGIAGVALIFLACMTAAVISIMLSSFSPGLRNTFSGELLFTSDRDGKREIYRLSGRGAERITFTSGDSESWDAVPAPDGGILFTSNRDGRREIYRLTGDETKRITFTPGSAESWDPAPETGGSFLFTSNRDGKREVYRLTGQTSERITFTPGSGESWDAEPAGPNNILFTSTRDGKREIYRLAGQDSTRVTITPGSAESWEGAPESGSASFLFTSNRDGKAEIYRISGANTERVTVSAGTSDDLGAYQSWAAVPIFGGFLFTSDRDGQPEIYRITGQSSEKLTASPPGRASWTAWSE